MGPGAQPALPQQTPLFVLTGSPGSLTLAEWPFHAPAGPALAGSCGAGDQSAAASGPPCRLSSPKAGSFSHSEQLCLPRADAPGCSIPGARCQPHPHPTMFIQSSKQSGPALCWVSEAGDTVVPSGRTLSLQLGTQMFHELTLVEGAAGPRQRR